MPNRINTLELLTHWKHGGTSRSERIFCIEASKVSNDVDSDDQQLTSILNQHQRFAAPPRSLR